MKVQKIELIEKAKDLIMEAIALLEVALQKDEDSREYLLNQIKTYTSSDFGFVSANLNMDELILKYSNDKERIEIDEEIASILDGTNLNF